MSLYGPKVCPACRSPFQPDHAATKWCGSCRATLDAERTIATEERRADRTAPRPCPACQAPFVPVMPWQRYCSLDCSGRSRPLHEHVCIGCGVTFATKKSRQPYCSMHCRSIYSLLRTCRGCGQRETTRNNVCESCKVAEKAAKRAAKEAARDAHRHRLCRDCGQEFRTAPRGQGPGLGHYRYCSDACRKRSNRRQAKDRRRVRIREGSVDRIYRAEVYARDGWRCGICGKKVPKDKRSPHPSSPTLDHIIPLSQGGRHVLVNVQLAHRRCNCEKAAGGQDQLRLLG